MGIQLHQLPFLRSRRSRLWYWNSEETPNKPPPSPFTGGRAVKDTLAYELRRGLRYPTPQNLREQSRARVEPVPFEARREETVEIQINLEVPDTRSALVTLLSRDLSPWPTGIEAGVSNIGPVCFVAIYQQLSSRWESGHASNTWWYQEDVLIV